LKNLFAFSLTDLQNKITFDQVVDKTRFFEKSRSKSIKFIRDKRLAQPRIIGSPIEPFEQYEIGDLNLKPMISNIISNSECKLIQNLYFSLIARVLTVNNSKLLFFLYIILFRFDMKIKFFGSHTLFLLSQVNILNKKLYFCFIFIISAKKKHILLYSQ
jgi:hypothetical protein